MRSFYFSLFLAIILMGCSGGISEYSVGLQSLPEHIEPRKNSINIYHFINLHLFFPLFQRDDNYSLKSQFLDLPLTKAIDLNFKRFQFCLQKGVRFTDSSDITADDLADSIKDTHQAKASLPKLDSLKINGVCVLVNLSQPDPYYFDKLTSVDS
jgi:ABC-type transport system substrate-binding protein